MSNFKIRVALEGTTKYRSGKKWKKRYCMLALSPENADAMHLYVTKSYDDFAPYRNDGCLTNANLPPLLQNSCDLFMKLPHNDGNLEHVDHEQHIAHSDYSNSDFTGPLVNSASLSCNRAAESTSLGLSLASSVANRMNAPAPIDEITGFESGYHMDKESNIIVLTGTASVHIIALSATDEMFLWADTMSQIMTDCRFRVTLRKSANGSKLPHGIQGSLHIQRWRLCLIGEPSAGCRFICCWRLDAVEKAYTMTLPTQQSSNFQTSDVLPSSRKSIGTDIPNRTSSVSVSTPVTTRPKHVLVLEATSSAGKGRGTNTFELDGGSINELITVIDQFMARRFCPDRNIRISPAHMKTSGYSTRSLCVDSIRPFTLFTKSPRPSFTSSHGNSGDCHPASAVTAVQAQPHPAGSFNSKSTPLTVPISCEFHAPANLSPLPHQITPYGRSISSIPSSSFVTPPHEYSNLTSSTSSFSPSDHMSDISRCHNVSVKFDNACASENPALKSYSYPQRSTQAGVDSNKCLQEEITNNVATSKPLSHSFSKQCDTNYSHSYFGRPSSCGVAAVPSYMNITTSDFPPTQKPRNLLLLDKCITSLHQFKDNWDETDGMLSTNEETQVARVPAGLVISKRPGSFNKTMCSSRVSSKCIPTKTHNEVPFTLDCNAPVKDNQKDCITQEPTSNFHRPCRYRKRCCRSDWRTHHQRSLAVANSICTFDQQTSSKTHPDNSNFSSGLIHHGVFTADEDLADAEITTSKVQNSQAHLHVASKVPRSSHEVPCNQCISSRWRTSGLCTWCCCLDNHCIDHLNRHVYRHRYQQYRMCSCFSYLSRSLSSNMLYLLDMLPVPTSDNPLPHSAPTNNTSMAVQSITSDPSGVTPSALDSTSLSCSTKALCNDRWKPIHRFFHRRHSKSHESLEIQHHPLQIPGSSNTNPVTPSVVETGLNRIPCASDLSSISYSHLIHKLPPELDRTVFPDCLSTTIPTGDDRLLALICSRHGSRSYRKWFLQRLLLNLSLSSTRSERSSSHAVTMAKLPRLCVYHGTNSVTSTVASSSMLSTIKNLVNSKHKLKGKSIFGKIGASRPKSSGLSIGTRKTSARDPPSQPVELPQDHPTDSVAMDPLDLCPSSSKLVSLCTPADRSARFTHCICSSRSPCRRHMTQSTLSLASLACSEPAISRTTSSYIGPLPGLHTRSFCSSVSSLLTFQSMSGSSSMLSNYVTGDGSVKQSARAPSVLHAEPANTDILDPSDLHENVRRVSACSASASGYNAVDLSNRNRLTNNDPPDLTENLYVDCSLSKQQPLCDICCYRYPSNVSPSWASFTGRVSSDDPACTPQADATCFSSALKESPNPPRLHSKVPLNESSASQCWLTHHAFHRFYQFPFNSQRAHTLPSTKTSRNESGCTSLDLSVGPCDPDFVTSHVICHPKISAGDASRLGRHHGSTAFNRLLPRFSRKVLYSLKHDNGVETSFSPTRPNLDRKLSCQSACSIISNSAGDEENALSTEPVPYELEFTNYCNVFSSQRNALQKHPSCEHQHMKKPDKQSLNPVRPAENSAITGKVDLTQSIYVNLPLSNVESVSHFNSCGSRSGRLLQHVLHAVHHHSTGQQVAPGLNSKVIALQFPGSSSLVGILESRPHCQPFPKTGLDSNQSGAPSSAHAPSNARLCPFNTQESDAVFPASSHLNSSVGMSVNFDFSTIPAEVRDPSRNYAMVDLRPSPASSVNANAELTIGVTQNRQSNPPGGVTSADSSTGSTIGFSNSTSTTGSDGASDAATLTSDTPGSCAQVCPTRELSVHGDSSTSFALTTASMETSRRRHSHSLSLAPTDGPILNYVHVVASTAPLANPELTQRVDGSSVSDPICCPLSEHHADSPSSSSGLGGIASHSVTPPLVTAGNTSSVDIFNSRSMTSSATSGEGNSADLGFHSYSPEHDSVAYTQIDFARTLALGEVRGDMEQQENAVGGKACISSLSGFQTVPAKVDRSISMRKTFSRPIRSIRRGSHKKSGGFLG